MDHLRLPAHAAHAARAAIAATAGGRYDEAEEGFRSAIERAEELGLRIEGADLRRLYSGMLLERGDQADREAARSFLDEAAKEYASMGMPALESLARSMSD